MGYAVQQELGPCDDEAQLFVKADGIGLGLYLYPAIAEDIVGGLYALADDGRAEALSPPCRYDPADGFCI